MPDYGVPADPNGALPWTWALERLVTSPTYWLATVGPDARPHAMPLWGLWRADDTFWFSCGARSRKARNLAANPRVVVGIEHGPEVVSVEGTATAVAPDAAVAAEMATKYEPDPGARETLAEALMGGAMYRVEPERAFGIIERPDEFSSRATRWVW